VAVYCCVAPTVMLTLDGATEIEASVGGATLLEDIPRHPVFAIRSEMERRQTEMESTQLRRIAICLIPKKNKSAKVQHQDAC